MTIVMFGGKRGGLQIKKHLNPIENLWAELKRYVRARRPTNLTQLQQLCQEEWAKIHSTYCGKLVEDYPKCLAQVKPFKCYKILIECM
uniref:Tc1-like transposase DDE domain-containing protein n=1 Tax=Oncorhynchus tshawytscha TaxID=74940 RepID=A0A8C8LX59_ONCTS